MKKVILYSTAVRKKCGGYSPPDRSNLVGWWDASAITGLANNDPVSSWTDKSGLGYHLVQATAGAKPTYKTNQQNGRPAVSFDGGDWLNANTLSALFTGADKSVSCIAVLKRTATTGDEYVVAFGGDTTTPLLMPIAYATTDSQPYKRDDASNTVNPKEVYGAGTGTHIQAMVSTGTVVTTYTNGVKKHDAVAFDVGETTLTQFAIGCLPAAAFQWGCLRG